MYKNPLLDKEFLKALDNYNYREVFIKVIALTAKEEPIKEITGRVTQGSISIDGTSSIRRSCSFTMLVDHGDDVLKDFTWTLKTKFRLYIGLKNFINKNYPEIIWFKQGLFLTTSFSPSYSATGVSISIQGKDKMSLLNGDISGSLTASSYNFSSITDLETGKKQKILIRDIVFEAVRIYAQEPLQNIIISDLDDLGVEYMKYNGSQPFYVFMSVESDEPKNFTIDGTKRLGRNKNGTDIMLQDIPKIHLDSRNLLNVTDNSLDPMIFYDGEEAITVIKYEAGDIVGYRTKELIYPEDLVGKPGESIEGAVLSKIAAKLGDFEYFYDIDGRFHFQRKKDYLNIKWNNSVSQDADYIPVAMSNTNYKKNQYYIKNSTIGYKLADFDSYKATDDGGNKIIYYKRIENENYYEPSALTTPISYSFLDSRMIVSFSRSPQLNAVRNDFSIQGERTTSTGGKLPIILRYAIDKKPERYTTFDKKTYVSLESKDRKPGDIVVDWRELIYQMSLDYNQNSYKEDFFYQVENNNDGLYLGGRTGYEQYYTDINGFWRQLYDLDENGTYKWSETVLEHPELLNFWFDFLSDKGELGKFSVPEIGDRIKAQTNNNVKAIYFKDIPTIIYVGEQTSEGDYLFQKEKKPGYTFMNLPDHIYGLFDFTARGNSAMEQLNETVYKFANFEDSITINCIPIYYLEPNNKILVKDDNTGINGEYMINKITIPLNHNGTMSINATKVIERLL